MKKIINKPADVRRRDARRPVLAHPESQRDRRDQARRRARRAASRPGKVGIVTGGGSGHLPRVHWATSARACSTPARSATSSRPDALPDCRRGDQRGRRRRRRAVPLRQLRRRPHELRHGVRDGRSSKASHVGRCWSPTTSPAPRPPSAPSGAASPASSSPTRRRAPRRPNGRSPRRGRRASPPKAVARTPLDRRRALALRGARPPAAELRDRRRRDRVRHGHPRRARHLARRLKTADELADEMIERAAGRPAGLARASRVAVLVNSLGATPLEELYILYRRVAKRARRATAIRSPAAAGRPLRHLDGNGRRLDQLCFRWTTNSSACSAAPANCPFWSV